MNMAQLLNPGLRFRPQGSRLWPRGLLVLAALLPGLARADGPKPVPMLPAYQQECAACHLAYPPGLLPKASWLRLMAHLPRHFGTDASLDPAATTALGAWLDAHAGTYKKVQREAAPPPEDRITRSAWFQREHREFDATVWKRPAIGSASNCAACHTSAAQGRFNEHEVRVPR